MDNQTDSANSTSKKCSRCKQVKNIDQFYKDGNSKNGMRNECKACKKKYAHKYRKANKKKRNKYNRIKYKNNYVFRYKCNLSRSLRKKYNNVGESKNHVSFLKKTNITYGALKAHFDKYFNKPCERCKKVIITNKPINYEVDHIIPISLITKKDDNATYILDNYLYQLHNLRLICKNCNQEKSNKIENKNKHKQFLTWKKKQNK